MSSISTEESQNSSLRIAPNPSQGYFQILNSDDHNSIRIKNLQGMPITELKSNLGRYNTSSLSPGIYLVELMDRNKMKKAGKLVIL